MKRQRSVNVNGVLNTPISINPPKVEDTAPMATMGKKKAKKEGGEVGKSMVKVEVVEEIMKENKLDSTIVGLQGGAGAGDGSASVNWEEYMPWVGGGVDEQMSWGSTWFPGWDMDFMGESFTALMYSDVVWDDDIWNLRKDSTPIPLDTPRFNWR